ncbi:hypothetical protein AOB46_14845 [Chryseobacterium indologenes]|uniref:Uncharacterized protein n=1 Tax=Chryseobacterium indologenes TaxID=253 RepID=A0A0N0IVB5_CHRID|nr:hypothetical protein AOB46_14845 [Chryseobacterium indologenes]
MIIVYLCRNLVSRKKRLKGNPVKIRDRPAAVSSTPKFLKNISTVFLWEGFQKRSKSEDLPENKRLTLSWNKA